MDGVTDHATPGLQRGGNKASNHWLKTPVGVEAAAGETPGLTGEFIGETHRGLEHVQTHQPTRESAPEGPDLMGSEGSD